MGKDGKNKSPGFMDMYHKVADIFDDAEERKEKIMGVIDPANTPVIIDSALDALDFRPSVDKLFQSVSDGFSNLWDHATGNAPPSTPPAPKPKFRGKGK